MARELVGVGRGDEPVGDHQLQDVLEAQASILRTGAGGDDRAAGVAAGAGGGMTYFTPALLKRPTRQRPTGLYGPDARR